MVDLNGHAAGNGGHSQGKPTAHRDLLYSDEIMRIVASAPSLGNPLRISSFRPAAITLPAPRCFAIWIASWPATPVAPRTSTLSPGDSRAVVTNGSREDRPGFGNAAATTSSTSSGTGQQNTRGATVRWHIEPWGARCTTKNTREPLSSRPTPSTPQVTGNCCGLGVCRE